MRFVIFGSGPSMNQDIADYVKGKCSAIAVSDAWQLAPWSRALVSHDSKWWRHHKSRIEFEGRRFCRNGLAEMNVEKFRADGLPIGCNSGLMAMFVARDIFKASQIILCGFDMKGTHFFGPHPKPLTNTNETRFRQHIDQFRHFHGPPVFNCTPDSALKRFPFAELGAIL